MQDRAVKSRQRIFNVACKLFAYHGYAATPIEEIVRKARINRPTLYYYFGSKAGLYRAVVNAAQDDRRRLMQNAVQKHQSLNLQLTELINVLIQFAREHRDQMRICFATAFAAPVVDGMMLVAAVRPPFQSFFDGPSTTFCDAV